MEILGFLRNLKDLILSFVSIFMTKICSQEESTSLDFNVNKHYYYLIVIKFC